MSTGACFHPPSTCQFSGPRPPSTSFKFRHGDNRLSMETSVRIAVIGDVHGCWNLQEDTKALALLKPDLVLFTGDFGDENVELVRSIADLKFAKAVILGNHDAWNTREFSGMQKDAVQLQLECLGEVHVGFNRLDFPLLKLSIVGGRPLSCGGETVFRKSLLIARYGVRDMNGSAKKIFEAAVGTPEDHSIIFLAHNGPKGLGSNVNDICGRDWVFGGGDHGDPDLGRAIRRLKTDTKYRIPLVVFGHMHKELAYTDIPRKMIVVGNDNTIYLNGAIVPRVIGSGSEKRTRGTNSARNKASSSNLESEGTLRAFTVVDIINGSVEKIAETWVSVVGERATLAEERLLFSERPEVSGLSL